MSSAEVPRIEFSLSGLADLLEGFVDLGYRSVAFGDADPSAAHLLLRHDVDLDLRSAVRVAEVEHSMGVGATYFLMVRSDCYNVLDRSCMTAARHLVELGHRIGLHLDASLYPPDDLAAAGAEERRILEWAVDAPVGIVSFHRPAPHLVGSRDGGFGVPHTYEPRFTEHITYVADSRGTFRFGSPFDTDAYRERRALQLLLHPLWWAGDVADGTETRLRALVSDHHLRFANRVADNCRPYQEMIR
ncbi:MAG: hypothetical protein R2698_01190 [Microthrixaceae bacterium]